MPKTDLYVNAACRDQTEVMYAYDEANEEERPEALDAARALCMACAQRQTCAERSLAEEQGQPEELRFGIRAWLTPAQRVSIERRGGLQGRDPIKLVQGKDGARAIPPIPDAGDQWSRHHTTLARKVVKWIAENVKPGQQLPTQTKLCTVFGCQPNALRRVMHALVQDGTLDFAGKPGGKGHNQSTTKYVRRGNPRVVGWEPPHLANGVSSDG